jgi:GT2 family glycosyltransferase
VVRAAQDASGAAAALKAIVPASVVIPTIGRPAQLEMCLASLAACEPRANEIVVSDQSGHPAVDTLVDRFAAVGARVVRCAGTGEARNANTAIQAAKHEVLLRTDDDCTVRKDWVARTFDGLRADPEAMLTGRVLPQGPADRTPSTIDDPSPRIYQGVPHFDKLYTGNMAVRRSELLSVGGFDPRIQPAASDNDLCYRWLKAGRRLLYEPELVVWHHDWRSSDELEQLYFGYGRGQGLFYAKHLCRGDVALLPFLLRDLRWALRDLVYRLKAPRPSEREPWAGYPRGLPAGLLQGLRMFCRLPPDKHDQHLSARP